MAEGNLEVGSIVAKRYRIIDVIGQGGFALVYGAVRIEDGASVVVKALHHLALQHDATSYERFRREATIAAGLEHENIVRTIDYGRAENGRLFLVMEKIDGLPLDQVMKDRPLSCERVGRILHQLMGALEVAHSNGVIHRDLKPTNILLCGEQEHETIKVIDFGLAKVMEGTDPSVMETLTAMGQIVGTPGYLSPEVLYGEKVTPLADIYAAGIIGHELLTGRIAYTGGSLDRVHAQARENPARPPSPIGDHPVYRVIEKLMAREVGDRYPRAGDAVRDLEAIAGRDGKRGKWWKFW